MEKEKIILNMIYNYQRENFRIDFKFREQESTIKINKLDIDKNLLQGNKLDPFLELLLYEEENLVRVEECIKLMQLKLNCVRLSDEIEVIRFVNDEKICRENIINIQQIDLGEEGFSWVLWYMKMQKINKDEL